MKFVHSINCSCGSCPNIQRFDPVPAQQRITSDGKMVVGFTMRPVQGKYLALAAPVRPGNTSMLADLTIGMWYGGYDSPHTAMVKADEFFKSWEAGKINPADHGVK